MSVRLLHLVGLLLLSALPSSPTPVPYTAPPKHHPPTPTPTADLSTMCAASNDPADMTLGVFMDATWAGGPTSASGSFYLFDNTCTSTDNYTDWGTETKNMKPLMSNHLEYTILITRFISPYGISSPNNQYGLGFAYGNYTVGVDYKHTTGCSYTDMKGPQDAYWVQLSCPFTKVELGAVYEG